MVEAIQIVNVSTGKMCNSTAPVFPTKLAVIYRDLCEVTSRDVSGQVVRFCSPRPR